MMEFCRPSMSIFSRVFSYIEATSSGLPSRRPALPLDIADELLLGACLLPYMWADLRERVSPQVIATDASPSGGGACLSRSLTIEGRAAAEDIDARPLGGKLLLVESLVGLGSGRMALDLLGIEAYAYVAIDPVKPGRLATAARWRDVIHYTAIEQVDGTMAGTWKEWFPAVSWVLHVAYLPMDSHGDTLDRNLVGEVRRVDEALRQCDDWTVNSLFVIRGECPPRDVELCTRILGIGPSCIEAGVAHRCAGDSIFWLLGSCIASGLVVSEGSLSAAGIPKVVLATPPRRSPGSCGRTRGRKSSPNRFSQHRCRVQRESARPSESIYLVSAWRC